VKGVLGLRKGGKLCEFSGCGEGTTEYTEEGGLWDRSFRSATVHRGRDVLEAVDAADGPRAFGGRTQHDGNERGRRVTAIATGLRGERQTLDPEIRQVSRSPKPDRRGTPRSRDCP
jgi:hypothetical protein